MQSTTESKSNAVRFGREVVKAITVIPGNANREYFESGVKDLATAELQYPGWLKELLTHPVKGLENCGEMIRLLTEAKGAIKVYCEVAAIEGARTALATS